MSKSKDVINLGLVLLGEGVAPGYTPTQYAVDAVGMPDALSFCVALGRRDEILRERDRISQEGDDELRCAGYDPDDADQYDFGGFQRIERQTALRHAALDSESSKVLDDLFLVASKAARSTCLSNGEESLWEDLRSKMLVSMAKRQEFIERMSKLMVEVA